MDEKLDTKTIAGLLGLLAHDLRNPLSALHSNIGFLSAAPRVDESELRDAVTDALVSCDGLVGIIDNIELLSQALEGVAPRSATAVAVGPITAEVVAMYRSMAESHEVELQIDVSATDNALEIVVHRDMFRRALSNVIRNAIQLGAGKIVRVAARRAGERVQLLVSDQGPRLDVTLGDEPFTAKGQLTAKTKTGGRYGRGLGLFCARFAAETAGAELIAAEPPPGMRNTLVLTAPAS